MTDDTPVREGDTTHGEHGQHDEVHMPPNSLVPISFALSLCMTLVGLLDQVRTATGPTVWLIGLLWLIGTLVTWVRAARSEYEELPETLGH